MDAGLAIILVIIIMIIIGIIIWVIISANDNKGSSPDTTPNKGNLDDICNTDSDCKTAYTCQGGFCKARIGSTCLNVNDCINTATACTKDTHVCTTTSLPGEGQSCNSLPCVSGFTCTDGTCTSVNTPTSMTIAGLNQSCSLPDVPCQSNLTCDQNSGSVCKIPSGNSCQNEGDCINGDRCGFQFDADGEEIGRKMCIPLIKNYKHCVVDSQCTSGRCGASSLLAFIPDDVRALEVDILDTYLNDGRLVPVQRFPDRSLLDVISEGRNLLMLLEDGTIIREVNNPRGSNFLETIHSNRTLQRLTSLGGITTGGPETANIYGLSDNILYELDRERSRSNDWIWRQVEWAPVQITHLSRSHDGNFLWIQYRLLAGAEHPRTHRKRRRRKYHKYRNRYHGHHYYPYECRNDNSDSDDESSDSDDSSDSNSSDSHSQSSSNYHYNRYDDHQRNIVAAARSAIHCNIDQSSDRSPIQWGALYQYTGPSSTPDLVQRTIVANNIQRSYGLNNLAYLEIDLENRQATRYPLGDVIPNFYVGILLSDGSIFKLGIEFIERVRAAVYARGLAHVITFRLCRPQVLNNQQILEQAVTDLVNLNDDTLDDSRHIKYDVIHG